PTLKRRMSSCSGGRRSPGLMLPSKMRAAMRSPMVLLIEVLRISPNFAISRPCRAPRQQSPSLSRGRSMPPEVAHYRPPRGGRVLLQEQEYHDPPANGHPHQQSPDLYRAYLTGGALRGS